MKKTLLLFMLVCAVSLSAQETKEFVTRSGAPLNKPVQANDTKKAALENEPTVVFNENFNGTTLPTGWSVRDDDGDGFNWIMSTIDGYENIIYSQSYTNENTRVLTPDNWLISPSISLSAGASNITLSYTVYAMDPDYYAEHYAVYVGVNNDFGTPVYEETLPGDSMYRRNVDLSSYAGQNIQVAFRHYNSTDEFILVLDSVVVAETAAETTALNETNMENTQVLYPNPVRDVLYFTEAAERVMVYTTSGQLLYQTTLNETEQSVNVSFLPQGLYMVRLMSKESVSTHLIIKE